MHQENINLFQRPSLYYQDTWDFFNGSIHFPSEIGAFSTLQYQETMMCQIPSLKQLQDEEEENRINKLKASASEETSLKDWILVFISICTILVLYYACICCLSGAATQKENPLSAHDSDELPIHEPDLRQNTSYHIDPEEGVCGVIQGPNCVETLFPEFTGENA